RQVEDLENRGRRNNIRVRGLPESEGETPREGLGLLDAPEGAQHRGGVGSKHGLTEDMKLSNRAGPRVGGRGTRDMAGRCTLEESLALLRDASIGIINQSDHAPNT
ncbi:Hypothetical predicted protein, partial [Pelobates cultripes]